MADRSTHQTRITDESRNRPIEQIQVRGMMTIMAITTITTTRTTITTIMIIITLIRMRIKSIDHPTYVHCIAVILVEFPRQLRVLHPLAQLHTAHSYFRIPWSMLLTYRQKRLGYTTYPSCKMCLSSCNLYNPVQLYHLCLFRHHPENLCASALQVHPGLFQSST